MTKIYSQAPLPFQGQKRRWNKQFKLVINDCFNHCDIFIDLFGGSGLLSRMAADMRPDATIIYNDYDDYHVRIDNIHRTNALLSDIRKILIGLPSGKLITDPCRTQVLQRIKQDEDSGYVDYITLSSNLLFSMKYATSHEEFLSNSLYNTIRQNDYYADGYLGGIHIVKQDYRDLFRRWQAYDNVCFIVDPPYLSTDVGTYNLIDWKLKDYLDVLLTLHNTNYVYFTSNKSNIIELCDWLEHNYSVINPLHGSKRMQQCSYMNYNSQYIDIMLYSSKKWQLNND